jgi:hypothetical protein
VSNSKVKAALYKAAWLQGFQEGVMATGEGWNGEFLTLEDARMMAEKRFQRMLRELT